MEQAARIRADQRNGNLHIDVDGQFTPDMAEQLTVTMTKLYPGKGNIFIHTEKITKVDPQSKLAFSDLLGISGLPPNNIYLTGENGFKFCHAKGKVIVFKGKKHVCCGKCKNCSCRKNVRNGSRREN